MIQIINDSLVGESRQCNAGRQQRDRDVPKELRAGAGHVGSESFADLNEINHNHESKIADNLDRNVGLIREPNSNIRRVVGLYPDLSVSVAESVEPTPPPSEGGRSLEAPEQEESAGVEKEEERGKKAM